MFCYDDWKRNDIVEIVTVSFEDSHSEREKVIQKGEQVERKQVRSRR